MTLCEVCGERAIYRILPGAAGPPLCGKHMTAVQVARQQEASERMQARHDRLTKALKVVVE